MGSLAQTFALNASKEPGLPANVYDSTDTAGTSLITTWLTWTTTASSPRRVVPFTNATTAIAVPAVGTAASGNGWRMRQAVEVAGTDTEPRRVPAGNLLMVLRITPGDYALLAESPTYGITAILYRIGPTGTSTEIARAIGSTTAAANTQVNLVSAIVLATDVLLAAGETLQVETYVSGAATANTLGTVTNNTVTIQTGPLVASRIVLPTPGLRTRFLRSGSDSAPAADSLSKTVLRSRAVTDSAPAVDTPARALSLSRVLSDLAPAADSIARQIILTRALTETAPAADSVARTVRLIRPLADAAPAGDVVGRALLLSRAVTDLAPASDTPTRTIRRVRQVTEQIGPGGSRVVIEPTPLPLVLVDGDPALNVGGPLYTRL